MARTGVFAPLTAALVRRTVPVVDDAGGAAEAGADRSGAVAGWREDLRLFAITWVAGFVFFLAFLA